MRERKWGAVTGGLLVRRAALPLCALALVAVVMAATSGTGVGSATPRDQPTSVVFTVVVTLLALAVAMLLVALVVVLVGFRSGPQQAASLVPRRRRFGEVAVIVAIVAVVVYLLSRLRRHRPALSSRTGGSPRTGVVAGSSHIGFVPTASLVTVGIVVALVIGFVVLPSLWRTRQAGWRRSAGLADLEMPGDTDSGAGAVGASVAAVRIAEPSEEPDPRRAVVRAYVAMTGAAERAGAPRATGETAQEFLRRLLDSLGVRSEPAERLTAVFERARYSDDPIGEDDREEALSALDQIRSDLVGVPASAPGALG
jgi:membrane protease YdiL (CAAX protease family)